MDRTALNEILDGTGAFSVLLKLRGHAPTPWLTVVTYHRVAEPRLAEGLDTGVVDARPATFARQMEFLKDNCNVISLDDLLAFKNGASLPANPVLVTFDDGYRDNHDAALPVLSRLGIPAVFFVATWYVEERRLFWWDKVTLLLNRTNADVVELEYPRKRRLDLRADDAADATRKRAAATRCVMHVIKTHYDLDLPRFLDDLERATGVALGRDEERRIAEGQVMTWDQVRELRRAGMSVQSHTRTHRVLHTLRADELREELVGSKRELEGVLGERVTAVAYPVGRGLCRAPHAPNAIREAGYELGFTNGTGINHVWRFDPIDVKRLSLELDVPDSYFHAMVALPYLAYEHHAETRTSEPPR